MNGEFHAHIGSKSLTQGVKQMLSRVSPFLKRPHVEFTVECASFILFCAAFLPWVAPAKLAT